MAPKHQSGMQIWIALLLCSVCPPGAGRTFIPSFALPWVRCAGYKLQFRGYGEEMKKRLLATLLALCLVLGLIPGEAWASHAGNSGEVKLLSLSVTDSGGKVISLLDKGVSVSLGKNYSFSATFSNADQLGKVYITSTKGNETKYLEAYRDGSAYVTRGLFDGDANYVPGKISVEYTKKIEDIPITADVSWNEIASVLGNSGSVKIDSSSGD